MTGFFSLCGLFVDNEAVVGFGFFFLMKVLVGFGGSFCWALLLLLSLKIKPGYFYLFVIQLFVLYIQSQEDLFKIKQNQCKKLYVEKVGKCQFLFGAIFAVSETHIIPCSVPARVVY